MFSQNPTGKHIQLSIWNLFWIIPGGILNTITYAWLSATGISLPNRKDPFHQNDGYLAMADGDTTTLVVGEPFVIKVGTAVNDEWFPELSKYQTAAKKVAKKFNAACIPFQSVFGEAAQQVSPTYWSEDGVYPTMAGSQLMA